jgi:hypothetical protein
MSDKQGSQNFTIGKKYHHHHHHHQKCQNKTFCTRLVALMATTVGKLSS